jgi:protein-disulfide isomerase
MTSESEAPRLTLPVGSRDHVQGPADAPITLLEYGDYECPYCGEAYPIVKEIQRRLGGELRFVFRNFPLPNLHPHATLAASAAEAMGAFGKFWEMHDMLYEHQTALTESDLIDYARRLGQPQDKFRTELHRPIYAERVREDFASGVRSGVNGTPTFYINDVRHNGSYALEELLDAIEDHRVSAPEPKAPAKSPHRKRRRSIS